MDNKLIKKEDVTVLDKIKAFFSKIFKRDKTEDISNNIEQKNVNENLKFEENLKVNIFDINEREKKFKDFIEELEDNPNLVEKLSEDRLDKLISYYEKLTAEKAEKIKRLKSSLN